MKYKSMKGVERPCKTGKCKTIISGPRQQDYCKPCTKARRRAQSKRANERYQEKKKAGIKYEAIRGACDNMGPVLPESTLTHCRYCGRKLSMYNHVGECLSDCAEKKAALGNKYRGVFSIGGNSNRSGLAMH